MNTPFDEQVGRVFEPFERDHDRLRSQLMASLPAETPRTQRSNILQHWMGTSTMRHRLIRFGIVAAAAVVVITFLNLRPSHKGDGIAWADVQNRINLAKTLIISDITGFSRTYIKDPGLMRREQRSPPINGNAFSQPADWGEPDNVEIEPSPSTGWRRVVWSSSSKHAAREQDIGCRRPQQQCVTDTWAILRRISTDDTRKTGETSVNSHAVVIFEVPFSAYLRILAEARGTKPVEYENSSKITIKIYVSKQTAAPIREEYHEIRNGLLISVTEDLQWDAPISDELFQIPLFDDNWIIEDNRTLCFTNQSLKAGNTFHLGPPNGPAIITEADVTSISVGTDQTFNHAKNSPTSYIYIGLSPNANERLADYTRAHINDDLIGTFNDKRVFERTIREAMQNCNINITPLGVKLEEFEQKYLAPKPSDSAPASK